MDCLWGCKESDTTEQLHFRRREKGPEKIFEEIIAENSLNMEKEIVNQVQEVQRVPGKINLRRNTRHKVIKIKDNDKILKATRENDK